MQDPTRQSSIPHFGSSFGDTVLGSGFFADTTGRVITAQHVIQAFRDLPKRIKDRFKQPLLEINLQVGVALPSFRIPGQIVSVGSFTLFSAKVLQENVSADVAILQLERNPFDPSNRPTEDFASKIPSASIGIARFDQSRPIDGEAIALSGFPLSVPTLVTTSGHIASAWRLDVTNSELTYLADIQVNPGNSGGPVYRVKDATIIGVAKAYLTVPVTNQVGTNLLANSGLTVIVPVRRALDLLKVP